MLGKAFSYAKTINLKELWLKVVNENTYAIKAYKNFGFNIYQSDTRLQYMKISLL